MKTKRQKTSTLDYPTFLDLARSRNIRCVEAQGLDTRRGIRFSRDGQEWIAVDAGLPVHEKIRTLGYLLESKPKILAAERGFKKGWSETSRLAPVLTLCC